MTTWLADLARRAAEARSFDPEIPKRPWFAFRAACTPERIAALVRVAEAAGDDAALIEALRDLEATL